MGKTLHFFGGKNKYFLSEGVLSLSLNFSQRLDVVTNVQSSYSILQKTKRNFKKKQGNETQTDVS